MFSSDCRNKPNGMKQSRSVDFSHIRARVEHDNPVASLFSTRAARDSYKELDLYPSLKESSSQDETDSILTSASWRRRTDVPSIHDMSDLASSPVESDNTNRIQLRIPIGTWTVGKVSVFILLLAFVVDYSFSQVQQLESPDMYDALSADVIRPAFRYIIQTTNNNHNKERRFSLGSAAISSVTESLAPILPFTGGLDLRREDYWTSSGSWFETLHSVVNQVQDAFSSQQEVDETATKSPRNAPTKRKRKPVAHVSSISATQPFVSINEIADLSLTDVSETFRYAMEVNKPDFNEGKFVNSLSPRVRRVVQQMQEAAAVSRGKDTKLSVADPSRFGQIDALLFCAAMRIFAEWRVVRQVPEGYKGYAVGMNLGHKDIVQNVAKIESTAHAFLNHRRDMLALQAQWEENGTDENCPIDGSTPRLLRSPTILELMQYEIDMEINPESRLPRLKDKSGSMGLLWTRRQLHYQTLLLDNVLKIPNRFSSTADAVLAAYREVYDRFHGWAVQKIFNYSFQAAPEAERIFKNMNPHRLKECMAEARRKLGGVHYNDSSKAGSFKFSSDQEDDNPLMSFFKHVGSEWDKIVSNVVRVIVKDGEAALNVRGGGGDSVDSAAIDKYVTGEMVKDAYERIPAYLDIVYPLLDDLALTFEKLNMDDPSKV